MGGSIVVLKSISSTPMTHWMMAKFTLPPDSSRAAPRLGRPAARRRSHEGDGDLEQLLDRADARAVVHENDQVIVRVHLGVVVRHDHLVAADDRRARGPGRQGAGLDLPSGDARAPRAGG